jgi:hypothetical protein
MKSKVLVGMAAAAASVVLAAPVHADADTYLAYLSGKGVNPIWTMTPGNLVSEGLRMCERMRAGMTPQDAAGSLGIFAGTLGAAMVDAAQHELCPDTLGR